MNAIARLALLAGLLLFLTGCSKGCDDPDKEKGRQFVEDSYNMNVAADMLEQGVKAYESAMILDAAQKLNQGLGNAYAVKIEEDHRTLPLLKSRLHIYYGMALMDIYLNADKSSLEIVDRNTNQVVTITPELAMSHVDKGLELVSTEPIGYFAKGYILLMSGTPEEAVKSFNNAIGRDNSNPGFYGMRALAFFEQATLASGATQRGPLVQMAQKDCLAAKSLGTKTGKHSYIAYEVHVRIYLLMGDKRSAEMVIMEMQELGFNTTRAMEYFNRAK